MPRVVFPLPDLVFLQECFEIIYDIGRLYWKVRPQSHFSREDICINVNNKYSETLAGYLASNGYYMVGIKRRMVMCSRVIFKIHYGRDPIADIDHIDLDTSNDKIDNIRESTRSQNMANRHGWGQKSKIKGVRQTKSGKKWEAAICINYQQLHLGTFDTKEEAIQKYTEAAKQYYGEFARTE